MRLAKLPLSLGRVSAQRRGLTFVGGSRSRGGVNRTLIPLIASMLLSTGLSAAKPPNIVLIISDDQAWTDYSFMGHEAIETPNIDRLAKQS